MNVKCLECDAIYDPSPVGPPPQEISPTTTRSFSMCPECESHFAIEISIRRPTQHETDAHFPTMVVTHQSGGCPSCIEGIPSIVEDFLDGYLYQECTTCGYKWY